MFDLNDIYRKFGLKGRRQPSDWKTGVRRHFSQTANLRVGHTHDENGYITNRTYATIEALYAYAMWVDVEFYMVVVEAFAALTRGETEKAEELSSVVTKVCASCLYNRL